MRTIKNPQILLITITILAFLGFLDSTYLTILHFKNIFPPCALVGCEKVLTSQFSEIGGLPVALLGSLFYIVVIIFSLILIETKNKKLFWILLALAAAGLGASLVFFFLQAFVLHAFCQYCLISEVISFIILIFSLLLLRLKKD